MPGGLEFVVFGDLKVKVDEDMQHFCDGRSICWIIKANTLDMTGAACIPFVHDYFHGQRLLESGGILVCCDYSTYLDGRRTVHDVKPATLLKVKPTSTNPECFIVVTICPCYESSPFGYLKIVESWVVVARHLRDNATEIARLRLRFKETFLLVEVGVWEIWQARAMNVIAFALVPLVDEVGLMDLFNTQSTRLQFLEKEGSTGRLLPLKARFVRISILDLGKNRVGKLGEGFLDDGIFANLGELYQSSTTCFFPFLYKALISSLPLRRKPLLPERREKI